MQNRKSAKSFDVSGEWIRWSRYDLLNGVVVPADDAEQLKYDPWGEYRSNDGRYRTVKQPYTALLELNRSLKETASGDIQPSPMPRSRLVSGNQLRGPQNAADRLILDWCNQHGLLGLLPVLSNSIRPPITVEPERHQLKVAKHLYYRDGGIWRVGGTVYWISGLPEENLEERAAKRADEAPKPGFTWFDWTTRVYEEKPLEDIQGYFIRTPVSSGFKVHAGIQVPPPNSPDFWRSYSEPLREFARLARGFSEAVDCLSKWESGVQPVEQVQRAHFFISGLAQSAATPSFIFKADSDTVYEERVSAGLLASYALMFLWDRLDGRRALQCENCGRYFVSNEYRARYCKVACRNTAQSRRYRANKKVRGSYVETRTE